jgi:hypothetical protein
MLGLVLVAAMPLVGCGEAVGPPEGSESGAVDLEFVLPPVQGDVGMNAGVLIEPLTAWVDSLTAARGGALALASETTGRIEDVYLIAGFNGHKLTYEYGAYIFGSGYSLTAEYTVLRDNNVIRSGKHGGIALSLGPINVPLVPATADTVSLPYSCGLEARVTASFKAYFGVDLSAVKVATSAERNKATDTMQPGCQSPSPTNGEGGGGPEGELTPVATVTRYTICYYELWVDSTGAVVSVVPAVLPFRVSSAQGPGERVQVALVESLSTPSARAEVVRFGGDRPDLILLRSSSVTTSDVVAALFALEGARRSRPARPGLTARLTVLEGSSSASPDLRIARRAEGILRQLKSSPSVRIGNLGRGRWGEFDAR